MDEAWQFAQAYFDLITAKPDADCIDEIHEGDLVNAYVDDDDVTMVFVDVADPGFKVKATVTIEGSAEVMDADWHYACGYFGLIVGWTEPPWDSVESIHAGDLVNSSVTGNVMRFSDSNGYVVVVTVTVEDLNAEDHAKALAEWWGSLEIACQK